MFKVSLQQNCANYFCREPTIENNQIFKTINIDILFILHQVQHSRVPFSIGHWQLCMEGHLIFHLQFLNVSNLSLLSYLLNPSLKKYLTPRKGTARSVTSVTMGVGEMDRTALVLPEETPIRPFLLLDLRDTDLFSRSHLSLAVNYPAIRLELDLIRFRLIYFNLVCFGLIRFDLI